MVLKRALLTSTLLILLLASIPPIEGQRKRRQRGEPAEVHMTNQQELEEVEKLEKRAEEEGIQLEEQYMNEQTNEDAWGGDISEPEPSEEELQQKLH